MSVRRLLRSAGYVRRRMLVARVRWIAWLHRADVDIKFESGVWVGRRVLVEVIGERRTVVRARSGSRIGDGVLLRLGGGQLSLGRDVDVRGGAVLNVGGGQLVFDGPNNISWGVVIHCAQSVHLARHAHVAEYSTIVDSSHYYTAPDDWSYHNTKARPVTLGEDVWVCPKSTITGGVTIGHHTIVGSNSVVTRDAPPGVLVSGVPAVVVRSLDLPWVEAEDDEAPS